MKKVLALIMVLALSLSFASCGKKPTDNKEKDPASQVVSVETNDDTETDTDTESQVETSSEIETDATTSKEEEKKPVSSKAEADKPTSSKEENKKPVSSKTEDKKPVSSKTEEKNPVSSKTETNTPDPAPTNNFFLNENNNTFDIDSVSVKPRYVYWGEDGALYAECFVINGFSHNVFNINVTSITLSNKSGVIAEGTDFGVLNGVTLAPRTHVVWGFKFTGDAVKKYGADLSTLICNARVSNNY